MENEPNNPIENIYEEKMVKYVVHNGFNLVLVVNEQKQVAFLKGYEKHDKFIYNDNYIDLLIPCEIDGYTIISIGHKAFSNCAELKSIVLPESIVDIGDSAFRDCGNLENIVLSKNITHIGQKAFQGCFKLTKITFPNSLTEIGDRAFNGCKSLKRIVLPKSVTKIGQSVFGHCSSLKKITIPDTVKEIGTGAFYYCEKLISIDIPCSVKKIGQQIFKGCTGLKKLIIPDSVLEMGDCIIYDSKELVAVKLPNSVRIYGDIAFTRCTKLKELVIPNSVKKISDDAFLGCDSLINVTIPSSMEEIGQRAFYGCSNLKEIVIPNSVKIIGQGAFRNCFGLVEVAVPNNVTTIEENLFFGCLNLKKVKLSHATTVIGHSAFFGCSGLTEFEIPANVVVIGRSTFEGCSCLKKIVLPDSIEEIGDLAFKDCKNIRDVVISKSIKKISQEIFCGCSKLNEIVIPNFVIEIGNNAFFDCKSLKKVIIPKSVRYIGRQAFSGCSSLDRMIIPDSVTDIQEGTFESCFALTSISIPDSITKIGDKAFMNCSRLTNVELPNTLISIGQEAFWGCSMLKELYIPFSIADIGNRSFANCKHLVSIIVAKDNVFYDSRNNCNAIIRTDTETLIKGCDRTRIPGTIKKIGHYAFSYCNRISSIEIPEMVTVIEEGAFSYCHFLNEIIIPVSLTTIEDFVFEKCDSLENLYIPNSVRSIGKGAFKGCDNLKKVICDDTSLLDKVELPNNVMVIKSNVLLSVYEKKQWEELDKVDKKAIVQSGVENLIGMHTFFDPLLFRIKKGVDFNNPERSYRKVFFKILDGYDWHSLKFIKYIDIFNLVDDKQIGNIEFYADFIHSYSGKKKLSEGKELITDRNEKVDIGENNELLNKSAFSIEQLYYKSDLFYREFELCNTYSSPISEQGLWARKNIIHDTRFYGRNTSFFQNTYGDDEFFYGEIMTELFHNNDLWQNNRHLLDSWLHDFSTCYDESMNDITNSFYYIGSPWKNMKGYEEICDYVVRAYVGIDKSKGEEKQIKLFLHEFQNFLEQITFDIIVKIKNYQLHQTAVVASIAQVMARNMSHNIGSHVFSNLINQDVYEKLSDNVVLQNNAYQPCFNIIPSNNLQIAYFNQYLKSRMDYLSEVTFGIPNMLTTKYVYGDVFKELDCVRILLKYISGIPGFKYTFCLKHNGVVLTNENDIAVALPSDVLGNQAFYNIIENIIRNTAKHACKNNQEVFTFTIEFTDIENFPEYYCVEIDNGIEEFDIAELVRKQNERINTSVLDKENNLRSHSLGLLEMEASAAFLRQVDIAKVDSYEYRFDDKDEFTNKHDKLILLKAINKNGALCYRFFIQKPKEFLLVGDFDIADSNKDAAGEDGVQFISEEEFVQALSDGKSFVHPFLVYLSNISERSKNLLSDESDCKTLLPVRKLRLEQEDVKTIAAIVNKPSCNEIVSQMKECVWKRYYENVIVKELKNPENRESIIVTEFDNYLKPINNQVVFLNHATKTQQMEYWQIFRKDHSFEGWIENLSSRTCSKLPEFSKYSIGANISEYVLNIEDVKPLNYEIFEAYHNKVLVLDERVQKFSKENHEGSSNKAGGQIPCSALFESTNVLMPEIQLDPIVYDNESTEKIEQFINDNMTNAFVLIHYGILERMYKKETLINDKLCAWARVAKRLVVTSGRGAHSLMLPPSVCFVNLSSVLYAFTENRNKFIINNLLNQTRRKNG